MDRGQPQKCVPDQYRAGDLQHDADPAAGRRPGRGRAAAAGAGLPAVAAGTVWHADPARPFDPAAGDRRAVRPKS